MARRSVPPPGTRLLPFLILLAAACTRLPGEGPSLPTEATARVVEEVPAGVVRAGEPLRIRFVRPVRQDNQMTQPVAIPVLSFEPRIDGTATWDDSRTLSFRPLEPLPLRQSYRAELDLPSLLPDRTDLAPLRWDFTVAGREVAVLDMDLAPARPDEPRELALSGELTFTEPTALDVVEGAAELRRDGQPVDVSWQGEGIRYRFTSATLTRTDSSQTLRLTVSAEALGLSQSLLRELSIPPQRTMQVTGVESESGETPVIWVEFSDEIDSRQDVSGLIALASGEPLTIRLLGRRAVLQGPFVHAKQCSLLVHPGVRSRYGTATDTLHRQLVSINHRKPQLRFARDGVFLPSAKERRLRFRTLNVSRVELTIKRVFADNLGFFLQGERLNSPRQRSRRFHDYFVRRVGVEVARDTLTIGGQRDEWLEHELDLTQLIPAVDQGLYLLSLRFGEKDMLYGSDAEREEYRAFRGRRARGDYRDNPLSRGYLSTHGRVYKVLVLSDIGMTCKRAHERFMVWVTRLADAGPIAGAEVRLRSRQNQIVARARTDRDGLADFPGVTDEVTYVEAEHDGQRSLVKPDEMGWSLSTLDTRGRELRPDGASAFIYTERGVYRPGDTVHVGLIARHADHTFPDGHPLSLQVRNPRDQLVFDETRTETTGGFCSFAVPTDVDAPTGNWRLIATVGGRTFEQKLKIETVAPQRLKVELSAEPERLGPDDLLLTGSVHARYLFGEPGAGLMAGVTLSLRPEERTFPRWPQCTFTDETLDYLSPSPRQELFASALDDSGRAQFVWERPTLERVPSALRAALLARVEEPGARPVMRSFHVPIDPYPAYVGLRQPDLEYGRARVGTTLEASTIVVDPQGEPVPGRVLTCRVYRSDLHWWWEFEDNDEARLRFRTGRTTELITETRILSTPEPVPLRVELDREGQYLIEVRDVAGHAAAMFLRASTWGPRSLAAGADAALLALRTDAEEYRPGDVAQIRFPLPAEGAALVTVERGAHVRQAYWHPVDGRSTEADVRVPITADMAPNAYVTVSVIQPYDQTVNDRPLRMYGVVPIRVSDPGTRQELELAVEPVLRPEAPFSVSLSTADGRPTQFTLAVVDEGLLYLTYFTTPDPWQQFFTKARLSVRTFDLFAHVIGAHKGDVFRTFAIGGSLALGPDGGVPLSADVDRWLLLRPPDGPRRFEPVSLFRGPLQTDARGHARVDLHMPNYVGAVRVMAVAAQGGRCGSAEVSVPVKSELTVVQTLPRVLGPGDRFTAPATVFAVEDGLEPVRVSLSASGPVVVSPGTATVGELASGEQRDVAFDVQVLPELGRARFELEATAGAARATRTTVVEVRPSAPPNYSVQEQVVAAGESVAFRVPDHGMEGTNRARVTIRRGPNLDLVPRAEELLRSPYGCVEQVVSAVFPQLYLKDLLEVPAQLRRDVESDIDRAVNLAIDRLRQYRQADGSFAFWPGSREVSPWCSCYVGHFLLTARTLGYHVPAELLEGWLKYELSQANLSRDELRVRVYRAYLLALAGRPSAAAMNLLRESALADMADVEIWLLAGAYRLAGMGEVAADLAHRAGTRVEQYRETGGTYGSGLRDQAIMLDMALGLERREQADALAREIAAALSAPGWLPTQTSSFALMALGKHLLADARQDRPQLAGHIDLPDGQTVPFDTRERVFQTQIDQGFGDSVRVHLATDGGLERAFATVSWEGVPLQDTGVDESHNLGLDVEWLDDDGNPIDPTVLTQGTGFWAHFRVSSTGHASRVEEVALLQILPAGWEIDNTRMSDAPRARWMREWQMKREDHLDLRDDRALWFFDVSQDQVLDFALKLNAVTAGSFTLPPTHVEALYDRQFRATRAGRQVTVVGR